MPSILADLRRELRDIRKGMMKPVSRMLKHEVLSELEKHRPRRSDSTKEEAPEPKKAVPKKTITKAEEKVEKVVAETSAPKKVVRKAVEKVEKVVEKKSKK